jgi:hypothetical protein
VMEGLDLELVEFISFVSSFEWSVSASILSRWSYLFCYFFLHYYSTSVISPWLVWLAWCWLLFPMTEILVYLSLSFFWMDSIALVLCSRGSLMMPWDNFWWNDHTHGILCI